MKSTVQVEYITKIYELHFRTESLDRLDVIIYENNVSLEVTKPKYTVNWIKNIRASAAFKCILL